MLCASRTYDWFSRLYIWYFFFVHEGLFIYYSLLFSIRAFPLSSVRISLHVFRLGHREADVRDSTLPFIHGLVFFRVRVDCILLYYTTAAVQRIPITSVCARITQWTAKINRDGPDSFFILCIHPPERRKSQQVGRPSPVYDCLIYNTVVGAREG